MSEPEPEAEPVAEPVEPIAPADQVDAVAPKPELSPAACASRLAELFPALFSAPPRPLKLRIQADIQERAPGIFTRKTLSVFLHRYTTTNAYLTALTQAPGRFDLDGAAAGELSDEHRAAAAEELQRRRGLHEARREAERAAARDAARESHRAAQAQAQQAQQARAADEQGRRDRAALLRAFETSTVTRANFCALKRITDSELDTLLAQARQEAEQRAAPPMQDQERRPPMRNRR